MKTKPLTAAQIDALARRLSETPVEPATSAKREGDTLARLLVARIGEGRAALAFTSILSAATAEQAEVRLTLVLDYGNTEPAADATLAPADRPAAAITPAIGKRQAALDQARTCALPPEALRRAGRRSIRHRSLLLRHLGQPGQADDLQLLRGRHDLEGGGVARRVHCRIARD